MVSRRVRGDQTGASAVEFALLLPLLIVLIFGIIFSGFAFNTKLTITQAAREGARYGATLPLPQGADEPDQSWFDSVHNRVRESAFGDQGLASGARSVCIRFVTEDEDVIHRDYPSGSYPGCDSAESDVPANRERVEVVVRRPTRLEFIFYGFDVDLRSAGIARYEAPIVSSPPDD